MSSSQWISERRQQCRARVGASAVLLRDTRPADEFLVENLCAGGALLSGVRRPPEIGERLRVILKMPRRNLYVLRARVARHEYAPGDDASISLTFEDVPASIQDAIQDEVVRALERERREGGPAVLVIDDSAEVRSALARQLEGLGYRPLLAAAPLDTIRILHSAKAMPDAALVDLFLGPVDGLDVLTLLASEHPGVRRVLMSGHVRPAQLRLALDSGRAHAVMEKPWSREELSRALGA